MNNFLSQLNLTAQERRIVAVIFLVVIVVLNYLFVWPRFGDWSSLNRQLEDMRQKIERYNGVIKQDYNPTNGWKMQVEELTKQEGGRVMEHPVDPQIQLQNTIRAQERKTGVYVESRDPGAVKTNEFFEEQSIRISLECQEQQLISFLYNMGMDPAMIRVSVLNLAPADANRYRLKASLTLTANYIKNPAATVGEAAANRHAAGAKPAATPHPIPVPLAKRPVVGLPPGANRRSPPEQNLRLPERHLPISKRAPN